MKQLIVSLILLKILIAFSINYHTYELEGFGADMNLVIDSQIVVSNQQQFEKSVQSNTHIQLAPGSYKLTKNLVIMSLTNIILEGPATLYNFGIYVQKSQNIILRNIRILNASIYGIFVYHSNNVIIDHCTILDAGRSDIVKGKCIDITQQAKNVTVSYSILGFTFPIQQMLKYKGLLAANFLEGPVQNISLHHNIFYCIFQRSPEISSPGLFDMRENIIFNYTEYGTRVRNQAIGNFVHNRYIGGKKDPLVFQEPDGIYSIENTWKYNCSQQRKIDDIVHGSPYITPVITSKDFTLVLKEAGCLARQTWQVKISSEIKQHI